MIQKIMHEGGIRKYILIVGLVLVALRLIFPVMHIQISMQGTTIEPCVTNFYPIIKCIHNISEDKLNAMSDDQKTARNLAINSFKPDFTRTFYQAVGLLILVFIILFIIKKPDQT